MSIGDPQIPSYRLSEETVAKPPILALTLVLVAVLVVWKLNTHYNESKSSSSIQYGSFSPVAAMNQKAPTIQTALNTENLKNLKDE